MLYTARAEGLGKYHYRHQQASNSAPQKYSYFILDSYIACWYSHTIYSLSLYTNLSLYIYIYIYIYMYCYGNISYHTPKMDSSDLKIFSELSLFGEDNFSFLTRQTASRERLVLLLFDFLFSANTIAFTSHPLFELFFHRSYQKNTTYIYIYIYTNFIKHSRHFLSTYFLLDPFEFPVLLLSYSGRID